MRIKFLEFDFLGGFKLSVSCKSKLDKTLIFLIKPVLPGPRHVDILHSTLSSIPGWNHLGALLPEARLHLEVCCGLLGVVPHLLPQARAPPPRPALFASVTGVSHLGVNRPQPGVSGKLLEKCSVLNNRS